MPGDDLYLERLRKVDELRARGVPVYQVDFSPTVRLGEARALAESAAGGTTDGAAPAGQAVAVAGRITRLRPQGGTGFADIEDDTGRMQMWFKADQLGERYALLDSLDLGDIVGVRGTVTRTRRGEPSVLVDDVVLLVKSLHPPPET